MFQRASKEMAKAKISIVGPSGAGKTLGALLVARGLVGPKGRCAVIDTENNSASLYADKFPGWQYDVCPLAPPYTAKSYFAAIEFAVKEKYDVLIIDSASHLWAGEGGLLAQKEAMDSRGGNSWTNWGKIGNVVEMFKSRVLHSPIHVIVTLRSKMEYVLETNEKGKAVPKKVGLAPVFRDGIEYEFTTMFDVDMNHQFQVSKDRTDLFDGIVDRLSEKTGEAIAAWLHTPGSTEAVREQLFEEANEASPDAKPETKAPAPATKTIVNAATGEKIEVAQQPAGNSTGNPPPFGTSTANPTVNEFAKRMEQKNLEEMQKAASTPRQGEVFHPGDYVMPFGKQWKGHQLKNIPLKEVRAMYIWATNQERPAANVREFIEYGNQYLTAVEADLQSAGGAT